LYFTENNFLQTTAFSIKPQHMFLSASTRSSYPTSSNLDEQSFKKFLQVSINNYDSAYNNESLVGSLSTISSKIPSLFLHLQSTFTLNQLFKNSNLGFSPIMRKFLYPELETKVNNNSDKTVIHNPLLK